MEEQLPFSSTVFNISHPELQLQISPRSLAVTSPLFHNLENQFFQNLSLDQHPGECISSEGLQLIQNSSDFMNTEDQSPPMTFQEFFNDLDQIIKEQSRLKQSKIPKHKLCRNKHCCSICQEIIPKKTRIYRLKCRHIFHSKCLDSWRKVKNNCPLCREELS